MSRGAGMPVCATPLAVPAAMAPVNIHAILKYVRDLAATGFARLHATAVNHYHGHRNRWACHLRRRVQRAFAKGLSPRSLLRDEFAADLLAKRLEMTRSNCERRVDP